MADLSPEVSFEDPPRLRYEDVAHAAGLSVASVARLVREGELHAVRLGHRTVRLRVSEVKRFLAAREGNDAR